jgi:hypothetical protein
VPGHENPVSVKPFRASNDVVTNSLYDKVLDAAQFVKDEYCECGFIATDRINRHEPQDFG